MKALAEACKKQGIPFGAYYSTCDWYHPDFPLTGYLGSLRRPQSDLNAYTVYLKRQVTELLLNYGPLAVLWFDVPQEFDAVRGQGVIDFVRSIQPSI
ncbi:MAG: alpha-L-fucosidase, partial [Bacteroidota bacterium]|nr:alpha-L-fucosidase [Bacteroidota bacterium]